MQQTVLDPLAQDPLQAHGGQLQLTPTAVLEQGQDREQGLWNTVYGGWRKYSALLWREALITTRLGFCHAHLGFVALHPDLLLCSCRWLAPVTRSLWLMCGLAGPGPML
jgi:hypothetical protein